MKCPRCHNEMEEIQVKENIFYFQCPTCGYELGKPKQTTDTDKESSQK